MATARFCPSYHRLTRAVLFCAVLVSAESLVAIPNAVASAVNQNDSPLNGEELSGPLLASALWDGKKKLPGIWQAEASVTGTRSGYLLARPKVLGLDALLVRSLHRDDRLEEIQVTFSDAGSFFGYFNPRPPAGLSRREQIDWLRALLVEREGEFKETFEKTHESLTAQLEEISKRPKGISRGRSRSLRAEMTEYRQGDLAIRVIAAPFRLIRLSISRAGKAPRSWLDPAQENLSERERLDQLKKKVIKNDRGDLSLGDIPIVPQGYRPYCGLNTLTMVGRYLGLHLDEDWLAVAGKFQNTGSAAGSQMLGLYQAVAKEAGFAMSRSSSYEHSDVRRSLQAGMPVIVWRRWSRERDREHQRVSAELERGNEAAFSPSAYPDEKAPLHASVVIGFNDERKEVIFLESWAGQSRARRMPVSELSATAYLTFCFRP
ncbi:C39 family peptidase [Akkermansiaceae bacterium]|nr:C39 family peptidase [Akkermansiaceae bacterium]MDA7936030.1 C39 family peptidase [bacterium]MDA7877679.1 C39 family peptidase [Akkermansiaceae bacterium]MDB4296746.1 C39 family peptidase [Akkermansiaceae bacterium]MDB4304983.1 C39 family peptidase [Akkermansiaceae bacterium]